MCAQPCGRHDNGPAYKGAVNIGCYGTDDAIYLDGSYQSQALLSPIRAHPVLDLGQDIRDKQESQVPRRYVLQGFVWAKQREEFNPLRDLPQRFENLA